MGSDRMKWGLKHSLPFELAQDSTPEQFPFLSCQNLHCVCTSNLNFEIETPEGTHNPVLEN